MERVRRRIKDRKVLRLVLAFLKADIMIEGAYRHPVTGTPQGGIISPLLANICLTAIDERYGRWSPRPGEEAHRATDRRKHDRKFGRPTFYAVRYADDFVVLVEGTVEQAEAERGALAEFLQRELRMELSMEKTRITNVGEGFDFLGYRVVREPARQTRRPVGKLFIPKSKLKQLRRTIKVTVREMPTANPLPISSTTSIPSSPAGGTITAMPGGPGGSSPSWTGGWNGASRTGSARSTTAQHGERCCAGIADTDPGNGNAGPRGREHCVSSAPARHPTSQIGAPGYRTDGKPTLSSHSFRGTTASGPIPTLLHDSCKGTRGASHARRAGCRETCTSGSARGMKRPTPATGQGVSSLLYVRQVVVKKGDSSCQAVSDLAGCKTPRSVRGSAQRQANG